MSNTSKIPWPPGGTWQHQCECCKDAGIIGGDTYEFRYCLCPAGSRLRLADAAAFINRLVEANATRDKLMGAKNVAR